MSEIGGRTSALLIAVSVISVAGAAGVTVYYQTQMDGAGDAVDERDERIKQLEQELDETERELREARLELDELRGIEQEVRGLESRNEDLRELLTQGDDADVLGDYTEVYQRCQRAENCSVPEDSRAPLNRTPG